MNLKIHKRVKLRKPHYPAVGVPDHTGLKRASTLCVLTAKQDFWGEAGIEFVYKIYFQKVATS